MKTSHPKQQQEDAVEGYVIRLKGSFQYADFSRSVVKNGVKGNS